MFALYCYKQQLSSVIMYQKKCRHFYKCSSPNNKFFSPITSIQLLFSLQHCHPLITTDTFRIIITFKGELLLSKCNCILVSSYPLSPPFPFDHNYTRRRVKWGEHGMGTIQHWLTTGTPFKSQKILFKTRALGSNLKYISASNIRPALPSYMNYFISLLSSHLLWASPRASRGSAIHVFLVRGVRKLCNRSLQTGK